MNDTQETVLAALRELDAVKARLARLEGARSCSDESHKSSAGTTNTPAAVASSVSSSGSPSASPTSGGSTAKPAWLAPLLPLPEGTERVRRLTRLGRSEYAAFPGGEVWLIPADHPGHWTDPGWAANEYTSMWESAEVYHVLLEHQAPSPAKIEQEPAEGGKQAEGSAWDRLCVFLNGPQDPKPVMLGLCADIINAFVQSEREAAVREAKPSRTPEEVARAVIEALRASTMYDMRILTIVIPRNQYHEAEQIVADALRRAK